MPRGTGDEHSGAGPQIAETRTARRARRANWQCVELADCRGDPDVLSLHHVHLMATDIEVTLAFWREHFGAVVMLDAQFAGARNVFLRVGEGRLHLYAQPPKHRGHGTVHHLGVETDELDALVGRLKAAGVSVTDVRRHPEACYAMAQGPDGLLLELFQPDPEQMDRRLADAGYFASVKNGG